MPRTRLSREARREIIIDAATEVFGRLGFEATRMDDVAKAAGIAKGLLYRHFASKDALFEALIARQAAAYAAELRGALMSTDVVNEPYGALRAGLAFWLRKVTDERTSFNMTDPGIHDAYDSLRAGLRQVIAEAVRLADPTVVEPYPRLLGALIQGAAENLGLAWRQDPGGLSADEALDYLAGFCWGGITLLRPPPSV